ncbi:hypothetical protein [Vibrio neptunius]|nr:hypothetical protein [Vibrio neptunius]
MLKNNGTEWVQIVANLAFLCALGVVSYELVNQSTSGLEFSLFSQLWSQ